MDLRWLGECRLPFPGALEYRLQSGSGQFPLEDRDFQEGREHDPSPYILRAQDVEKYLPELGDPITDLLGENDMRGLKKRTP